MIPKIVHYCWISGEENMPEDMRLCLDSWKKQLPDYEFINWCDKNFNWDLCDFTKWPRENNQYAFCSDYVRFWALYNYGGIYLDCDVMVFKSFNELLSLKRIVTKEWTYRYNDYVEAIIKLTDQGFLDTGISIYAWILNKGKKPARRKNIIQIIDASSFYHNLRKGIGQKRKEMTTEDIDKIVELYTSMPKEEDCEFVKYMTKEDFYYKEVTIYQPYQRNYQICESRINNLYSQKAFNSLWDENFSMRI